MSSVQTNTIMKNRLLFCFILWASLAFTTVQATVEVQATSITTNEGLANNYVRHICQDSKGFLWMSTLNGLTRYDGHSFVSFRPEKDKLSLTDQHLMEATEDKNQLLWIRVSPEYHNCYDLKRGCFVDFTGCGEYKEKYKYRLEASDGDNWLWHKDNGFRRITYKDGKFTSMVFKEENGKLSTNQVIMMVEGINGTIWACTGDGLVKVTNNECHKVFSGVKVLDAIMYKNTLFFVTSEACIYQIDAQGKGVKLVQKLRRNQTLWEITSNFLLEDSWVILTTQGGYVFKPSSQSLIQDANFDISYGRAIHDKKNNLWLYDNKGLVRYINTDTHLVKEFKVAIDIGVTDEWCHAIQDSRGLIWIATFGNGLYIYDPVTDITTHYLNQKDGLNRMNSNSLAFVMEDRSGGVWVSTESAGITQFQVLNNQVTSLFPDKTNLIDYANHIRLIAPMNNDEIWFGNRKGAVFRYDKQLRNQLGINYFENRIYAAIDDKTGKTLMASRGGGLSIDGRWYKNHPDDAESISCNIVFDLFRDHKQRVWIATFGGGLELLVPSTDGYKFHHYLNDNYNQRETRYVTSDTNQWMWVGTDNGLYVFHPDSLIASPKNYYCYSYENGKLPSNQVKHLLCDSKGRMWIGMAGGGLCLCTPKGEYSNLSFTQYTTSNGLVNNCIQSIIEDDEGKLWIGTEYGISRFSPETSIFENFFFSSTALGNVYNESCAIKLPDGRLLFGSYFGVTIIDPLKIISPKAVTGIALTNLKINGISMYPREEDSPLTYGISYTDHIELKYFQTSFVAEFSTFDYSMNNSAKYTYKLEPFDKEWSIPSSLNFAAYKKLAPGSYRLRVKACNSSGVWSEKETILNIVITPPFWKSLWAYLIYICVGGAILYVAFRLIRNFNMLRTRVQIEKQLTEYKLMFFTNISHEFRTPLTLIQGALEKLESKSATDKDIAYPIQLMSKSTDRLLRLVNQLLEFRKMQNNKLSLRLEEADVILFLRDIAHQFLDVARDKQIDYRFESSVPSYFMFIDCGKLDKIAYNLLSNAFKYTPNGGTVVFSVSVKEESKQILFSVNDTGVGISKEKQPELFSRFMQSSFASDSVGVGLHLTHELVNVCKGIITYQERKGGGSIFMVTLPCDKSIYAMTDFLTTDYLLKDSQDTGLLITGDKFSNEQVIDEETEKRKILVIEDDNDVRKFLEMELSAYYEVEAASDGLSGLEQARAFDGDLIVCDVLMPGMNGFEVTRQLKNNFETSHLPIILLTAMSTPENQLEGSKSGADAYVTKPFSPKLLLARIQQLIEQREKLRKKFSIDPTMQDPVLSTSEMDRKFSEQVQIVMEKQLANADFTLDDFASQLNLGRTVFFRKMKGVTGYTPNEYMRIVRMKKAVELLQEGHYNVSEIAYKIGLKDPHYFSRCFKEHFGVSPSAYLRGTDGV